MTPQKLRNMVDRCLTHVRCAQHPLRIEWADREPGAPRREVSVALLNLSDAEDRLLRAAGGDTGWTSLLAEVPSLCASAGERITKACLLEGKSICANLDAVIELLRLYGSADQVADAGEAATEEDNLEEDLISRIATRMEFAASVLDILPVEGLTPDEALRRFAAALRDGSWETDPPDAPTADGSSVSTDGAE